MTTEFECPGSGARVQVFREITPADAGSLSSAVCPRCRMVFDSLVRERWPPGTLNSGREGSTVIPNHWPQRDGAAVFKRGV